MPKHPLSRLALVAALVLGGRPAAAQDQYGPTYVGSTCVADFVTFCGTLELRVAGQLNPADPSLPGFPAYYTTSLQTRWTTTSLGPHVLSAFLHPDAPGLLTVLLQTPSGPQTLYPTPSTSAYAAPDGWSQYGLLDLGLAAAALMPPGAVYGLDAFELQSIDALFTHVTDGTFGDPINTSGAHIALTVAAPAVAAPEPATLALTAGGLLALARVARRRRAG
jgi:hypothetical protein